MMKNYICNGEKYTYSKGYIMLPVNVSGLPETINVDGNTLSLKSSFHVSLVCVKNILANQNKEGLEQMVIDSFCKFASENEISFLGFINEFRFAKFNERETLVVRCNVSNLKKFLSELSGMLEIEIPDQPTHITLYTLQTDAGIGLNSFEELESKSVKIPPPTSLEKIQVSA
jgi:hypothetical protein